MIACFNQGIQDNMNMNMNNGLVQAPPLISTTNVSNTAF